MYMKLKDGKSKVLTLSYDDAVVQDIRLVKIMDAHGIKGTFNVNSGLYLDENAVRQEYRGRMKLSEAQALYLPSGHEVAVHSLGHTHLEWQNSPVVIHEVLEDRKNLETQFGCLVQGMAYPYGTYSDMVIKALDMCGICYSRTVRSTEKFGFPANWLEWDPTCHHKNPRLMELARNFTDNTPRHKGENWLFYLWGHSYEFDDNDNWNVIEAFAQHMGGREDVWYATNMEIYDYVKAYKSLRTSADESVIYNPSVMDVWVFAKGQTRCIPGGETVTL